MDTWIISTAQQARPKVIHISEPVRAQVIRSSVEVTRKPLSSSSLLHVAEELASSALTGLPVARIEIALGSGAIERGVERHSHSSAPFFHS